MNQRMNRSIRIFSAVFLLVPCMHKASGVDVEDVLNVMPSDLPISIVITDVNKFDESLQGFIKKIDPDAFTGSIIDQFENELGIGKWVDFSQPLGLAQAKLDGPDSPLLWVIVPDFAEKIKTIEGATKKENTWHIPITDSQTIYVQHRDAFIVIATDLENLTYAKVGEKSLAQVVQNQNELIRTRDLFLHINFDAFREKALMGTAQLAQMAPMFAMLAAQKSGSDPSSLMGSITAITDSAQSLIKQISFIDLAIKINDHSADVTMTSEFRDGAIKQYLSRQQPAGVSLLSGIKAQSFVFAGGYHFPGTESSFFDYFFDKMINASNALPMGMPGQPGNSNTKNPMRASLETARDFHRTLEGENVVFSFTPNGLSMTGNYFGRDTTSVFDAARKYVANARSFLQKLSGGATVQSVGTKKIGNTMVEEFSTMFDPADPRTAQAVKLFGADTRIALGIVGNRVRHYSGSAQHMTRAFADRNDQPLSSSKFVKEAIDSLPTKRNIIILLDIASALPMIGPMFGMPATAGEIAPGPPIAVSVSLSGQPARLDIHIPVRAIERIMKSMAPAEEPM